MTSAAVAYHTLRRAQQGLFGSAEFEVETFITSALALRFHDPDCSDVRRIRDVSASVCLQIQSCDFHDPYGLETPGQEIDLGTNQVRNLFGFSAG